MENLPEGSTETIVYKVNATKNGIAVYSNIDSTTFKESGTQTITLNNIPVGSEVTIEQIYSGACSDCTSGTKKNVTLDTTTPINISFTNKYNGSSIRGGSLKDSFIFTEYGWENGEQEKTEDNSSGLEIDESYGAWFHHITFINNGTDARWVRAKVLSDNEHSIEYEGEYWYGGNDGYFYHHFAIEDSCQSGELIAEIKNIKENPAEGEHFNVIVVYETVPVEYNEEGAPIQANWK